MSTESERHVTKMGARIEIEYCTQCGFLLRAGWLAQEFPLILGNELGEVAPVPGRGGGFVIRINGEEFISRRKDGRPVGKKANRGGDRFLAALSATSPIPTPKKGTPVRQNADCEEPCATTAARFGYDHPRPGGRSAG